MVKQTLINPTETPDFSVPDANLLVTEDDTPVDNFASEKLQRLLTSSLYSTLKQPRFIAAANVGVYYQDDLPPIVPDVFVSFDVTMPEQWWEKNNRCYMTWRFGKPPDIAIEIVSNREGGERSEKLLIYQQMRVSYYVVYDPREQLGQDILTIFELQGRSYKSLTTTWLEQVELGLTLWTGDFEGKTIPWLRWCDQEGNLLLTGDEQVMLAEQKLRFTEQKAAATEAQALRLAEHLRSLGVDPDQI